MPILKSLEPNPHSSINANHHFNSRFCQELNHHAIGYVFSPLFASLSQPNNFFFFTEISNLFFSTPCKQLPIFVLEPIVDVIESATPAFALNF